MGQRGMLEGMYSKVKSKLIHSGQDQEHKKGRWEYPELQPSSAKSIIKNHCACLNSLHSYVLLHLKNLPEFFFFSFLLKGHKNDLSSITCVRTEII